MLAREPVFGEAFLADFEVRRQLGAGASGLVLLAHQRSLDRLVAIKYFRAEGPDALEFRKRFGREARTLARLDHPAILKVFGAGMDGPTPYLVEEYLEGEPLSEFVDHPERVSVDLVLAVGRQVAEALAFAHAAGVMHRDVKPGNVFVLPGLSCKLLDFGLARDSGLGTAVTQTGALVGTPPFLAPELITGAAVSPASDLYALGVTLFLLCTGEYPVGSGQLADLRRRVSEDAPPVCATSRLPLPAGLAAAIDRLLDRDPARRGPEASSVARELARGAAALCAGRAWPAGARAAAPPPAGPSGPERSAAGRPGESRGRVRAPAFAAGIALAVGALLAATAGPSTRGVAPNSVPAAAAGAAAGAKVDVTGIGPTWLDVEVVAPAADWVRVEATRSGGEPRAPRGAPSARDGVWRARLERLEADRRFVLRATSGAGGVAAAPVEVVARTASAVPRVLLDLRAQFPARAASSRAASSRPASSRPASRATTSLGSPRLLLRPGGTGSRLGVLCAGAGLVAVDLERPSPAWSVPSGTLPQSALVGTGDLACFVDSAGHVCAVGWDDGALRWRVASTVRDFDRALVATPDCVVVRVAGIGLAGLEAATGRHLWLERDGLITRQFTVGPDGLVHVPLGGTLGGLRCLDSRTGAPLRQPSLAPMIPLPCAPVVRGAELFAPLLSGLLLAGPATGPPRLRVPLGGEPLLLLDGGGPLFAALASPSAVVAVDGASGQVLWRHDLAGSITEAAVARDGLLYLVGRQGDLRCFAADDGRLLWTVDGAAGGPLSLAALERGVAFVDRRGRLCSVDARPAAGLH